MSEIRITLQGNAGDHPKLWTTTSRPFASVDVACTPRIRTDEEWADGDTQWVRVKAWGRLAENMAASIRKGDAVIVTGTMRLDEYTNNEGTHYRTSVIHANSVGFDLVRTRAQAVRLRSEEAPEPPLEPGWGAAATAGGTEVPPGAVYPDPNGEGAGESVPHEQDAAAPF